MQMNNGICCVASQGPSSSLGLSISTCFSKPSYVNMSVARANSYSSVPSFQASRGSCFGSCIFKQQGNRHSLSVKSAVSAGQPLKICLDFSSGCQNMNVKLLVPKRRLIPELKCNMGWLHWCRGYASAGLIFGLLICNSTSEEVHAEAAQPEQSKKDSLVRFSHGKKMRADYSVTGIPGDGRCLFRSVAHGACLQSGKPAPNESLQKELADELRARVCRR